MFCSEEKLCYETAETWGCKVGFKAIARFGQRIGFGELAAEILIDVVGGADVEVEGPDHGDGP